MGQARAIRWPAFGAAAAIVGAALGMSAASAAVGSAKPPATAKAVAPVSVACTQAACTADVYRATTIGSTLYVVRRSDGGVVAVTPGAKPTRAVTNVAAATPCPAASTACAGVPAASMAVDGQSLWILGPSAAGAAPLVRAVGPGTGSASASVPGVTGQPPPLAAADGRLWTVLDAGGIPTAGFGYQYGAVLGSAAPGDAFSATTIPAAGDLAGSGRWIACACGGYLLDGPGYSVFFKSLLVVDARTGQVVLDDRHGAKLVAAAGMDGSSATLSALRSLHFDGDQLYGVATLLDRGGEHRALFHLDPTSGALTATMLPGTGAIGDLAADRGGLWGVLDGKVARFDPNTLQPSGCIATLGTAPNGSRLVLAAGGGALWTVDGGGLVRNAPASSAPGSCDAPTASAAPTMLSAGDLPAAYASATSTSYTLTPSTITSPRTNPSTCTSSDVALAGPVGEWIALFRMGTTQTFVQETVLLQTDPAAARAVLAERTADVAASVKCKKVGRAATATTTGASAVATTFSDLTLPGSGAKVSAHSEQAAGPHPVTFVDFASGPYVVRIVVSSEAATPSPGEVAAITKKAMAHLATGS